MARATSLILLIAVVMNYVQNVSGHGWMVTPVPRSGGGTGSGNASTSAPCGGGTSTSPTATWTVGTSQSAAYMRANSHGVSGPNVKLTVAFPANLAAPTNADFTDPTRSIVVVAAGTMDTTVATPQTSTFTVPTTFPFNLTGPRNGVLQFHWTARNADGSTNSNWYDCAYISFLQAGPDACQTATCPGNSTCALTQPSGFECACNVGFAKSADGLSCSPLPPSIKIILYLTGIVDVSQNTFTIQLAALLNLPVSRILFDQVIQLRGTTPQQTAVYFEIQSDSNGASGEPSARELETMIRNGDAEELEAKNFKYEIYGLKINTEEPVIYGQGPDNTPSPKMSAGAKAGMAIGIIVGAAVLGAIIIAVVVVVIKKKAGGSSSKSMASAYPTKADAETPGQGYQSYQPYR